MAKGELYLGLLSGTSCDAVDACLARFEGEGPKPRFELLAHRQSLIPAPLRSEVQALQVPGAARGVAPDPVDRLLAADLALGQAFAAAALAICKKAAVDPSRVTAIGLHGQTVRHRPPRVRRPGAGSSLQLGRAAVVAERTGIPVAYDFRARDLAAGGEGAPLVPLLDRLAFEGDDPALVVNLGGIANLTWVPPAGSQKALLAFDTGPANALLDAACRLSGRVPAGYDRGGRLAARGTIDGKLLARLMAHPYLARRAPKSTGQEDFGAALVAPLMARHRLEDLLATLAAFTVGSLLGAVARLARGGRPVARLIGSGGGFKNPVLRTGLVEGLPGVRFQDPEAYGVPADAKEALLFALLARQAARGEPGNVPAATGSRGERVLGAWVPGEPGRRGPLLR